MPAQTIFFQKYKIKGARLNFFHFCKHNAPRPIAQRIRHIHRHENPPSPSIVRQHKLLLISRRSALHAPLGPPSRLCLPPLANGLSDRGMEAAVA
jgi:hypothetical protein